MCNMFMRDVRLAVVPGLCLLLTVQALASTFAWKNVNIQGMGYVTGLVIHPLPPHDIYIRSDVGGAYRYDRAAQRWLPLMDRFGTAESAFGVESIAVDPSEPNTVYAAVQMTRVYTATGGGYDNETTWGEVLVSHSRGVWWTKTGMPPGIYMGPNDPYRGTTGERLAVDPARPGVVYFGSRKNGLWRLDSSGWSRLGGGLPESTLSPGITFVLAGTAVVYAGVYGSGVWASADAGATWTLTGGPPNPVRGAVGSDGTLVVTCGGDEGAAAGSVARYRNGAWKDITPPGSAAAWSGVSFDPQGERLAVAQNGGRNVFYSSTEGDSWQPVPAGDISRQPPYYPPPTPANYYAHPGTWGNAALAIDPVKPSRLFQTNGYGVIASEDFTAAAPSWAWKMQNLEELVVLNIKVPPGESGADLFSVVADMIGFRHESRDTLPASTLETVNYVALGTGLAYCATMPQYMAWVGWDEATAALTGYSSDNGKTWTPFANASPGHAGRIAISAIDPNRLVWAPAVSATPQYSTDAGRTWQVCKLNGGPLPSSWQLGNEWWSGDVLAADRVDGNRFYLYNNGVFYFSMDGGATWQQGASTWPTVLPVQFTVLVNVVPNPTKAGDVWLSMSANQNQPERFPLFHSADGGRTFSSVTSLDSANFVAFGKGADADHPAIYVHGRSAGSTVDAIYQSLDLGMSWTPVSDPTQQQFGSISALEGDMRRADLVYVGTGGRGIFYGYGAGSNQPAPTLQEVVNGASLAEGSVAPGEVVRISGHGVGPARLAHSQLDEAGSRSTMVQGAQLFFDGAPAPLIYASANQVEAVVPYAVGGNQTTSIQASYLGVLSAPVDLPVAPVVPGVFSNAILNADSSVNSPFNPAARGDYVVIYATGEGQTAPSGVDGLITGSTPVLPVLPVTVQIDGLDATISFAEEAPRLASGILQIKAQIPTGAHPGISVPVSIRVGGIASQAGVTVAVK